MKTTRTKTNRTTKARTATLAAIARRHLGIETLDTRGRDCLDFHDVSVAGLQAALEAAYEAGRKAGR